MTGVIEHTYGQIRELIRARQSVARLPIDIARPIYAGISRVEDRVTLQLGLRIPKPMTLLLRLLGLSPGEIKLWHDAETGFFTEARESPSAPPVYRHVSDEVAATIIKGELTHELEAELMKPDEYLGE